MRTIPKVGGTKDLKFDRIRELEPTHVVVNVDENRKEDAEALAEFVPNVVVTHPLEPRDNLALYRQMGETFGVEAEAERLCGEFDAAYERAIANRGPEQKVLYLIWRDPWMTIAPETYISQTLALFSWQTQPSSLVAQRATKDEGSLSARSISPTSSDVDRVLLSSEPFHFKEHHVREVEGLVPGATVSLIDGEMTSWYGSRAIRGLDYLAKFTA